jgi:hypothetical protein
MLAARMCPGQAELVTQEVVQQEARLDSAAVTPTIYGHLDFVRGAH